MLEYCVQYEETSFDFVTRLMEKYGLYYFFTHSDGKHTLVIADDPEFRTPRWGRRSRSIPTKRNIEASTIISGNGPRSCICSPAA